LCKILELPTPTDDIPAHHRTVWVDTLLRRIADAEEEKRQALVRNVPGEFKRLAGVFQMLAERFANDARKEEDNLAERCRIEGAADAYKLAARRVRELLEPTVKVLPDPDQLSALIEAAINLYRAGSGGT
jgi:hypothetical protein